MENYIVFHLQCIVTLEPPSVPYYVKFVTGKVGGAREEKVDCQTQAAAAPARMFAPQRRKIDFSCNL